MATASWQAEQMTVVEPVVSAAASARRLEARLDEIVEEMVEAVETLPGYSALTGSDREGVASGLRFCAEVFLRVVAEDRRLDEEELAAIEVFGVERASQGVALASIHEAVRVAMRVGLGFLSDDIEEHLHTDEAHAARVHATATRHVVDFVHDVNAAFVAGHRRHRLGDTGDAGDAGGTRWGAEEVLEALLAGHRAGADVDLDVDLAAAAEASGLAGAASYVLVVVAAAGTAEPSAPDEALRDTCRRLPTTVPARLEGDPCALALVPLDADPGDATAFGSVLSRVAPVAERRGAAAVVERAATLADVPGVYRRLAADARLAARAGLGGGLVHPTDRLLVRRLATAGAAEAFEAVRSTLGAVLASPEHLGLLEVIDALARGVNKKGVALALDLTRGGVYYRIRRLRELTGLDPDSAADLHRLATALVAYRLHAGAMPVVGDHKWVH